MDISIFLEPVSEKCFSKTFRPGKKTLGETITIFRSEDEFPDLEDVNLALVDVKEERGAVDKKAAPMAWTTSARPFTSSSTTGHS